MIVPVRCFTCGKLVADKYEEFTLRLKSGEDPKKILDSLELNRYCCRRTLISTLDITEQLMPYSEALAKRHAELSSFNNEWDRSRT